MWRLIALSRRLRASLRSVWANPLTDALAMLRCKGFQFGEFALRHLCAGRSDTKLCFLTHGWRIDSRHQHLIAFQQVDHEYTTAPPSARHPVTHCDSTGRPGEPAALCSALLGVECHKILPVRSTVPALPRIRREHHPSWIHAPKPSPAARPWTHRAEPKHGSGGSG
jgi:hypothetical protein